MMLARVAVYKVPNHNIEGQENCDDYREKKKIYICRRIPKIN